MTDISAIGPKELKGGVGTLSLPGMCVHSSIQLPVRESLNSSRDFPVKLSLENRAQGYSHIYFILQSNLIHNSYQSPWW